MDKGNKKVKTIFYTSKNNFKEYVNYYDEIEGYQKISNFEYKLIKKNLYTALSDAFRKKSEWGTLTGIRPVKLCRQLDKDGFNESEIKNLLVNLFEISEKNSDLLLEIKENQDSYLKNYEEGFSLYINIPFCPSKCLYCSFPTVLSSRYLDRIDDYLALLKEEIIHSKNIFKDKKIKSVYIGGGTPTTLNKDQLKDLIKTIYSVYPRESIMEFTVEAGRPDTIDLEKLSVLHDLKIDRISINPQSMNELTLEKALRRHSPSDVVEKFKLARQIGFNTINMDLIIGLEGDTFDSFKNTLNEIKKLSPDNLTIHNLAFKKGSKIKRTKEDEKRVNEIRKMFNYSLEFTKENGYLPYYLYRQKNMLGSFENIGYSKVFKQCYYNIISMEDKESIIGCGMAAMSKVYFKDEDRIERVSNFRSLEEYMTRFNEVIKKKEELFEI